VETADVNDCLLYEYFDLNRVYSTIACFFSIFAAAKLMTARPVSGTVLYRFHDVKRMAGPVKPLLPLHLNN
jgi:hypothetical protein